MMYPYPRSLVPGPSLEVSWVQAYPGSQSSQQDPSPIIPMVTALLTSDRLAAFLSWPPFPTSLWAFPRIPSLINDLHSFSKVHFQGDPNQNTSQRWLWRLNGAEGVGWGGMSGTELASRKPSINSSYYLSFWFWSPCYTPFTFSLKGQRGKPNSLCKQTFIINFTHMKDV